MKRPWLPRPGWPSELVLKGKYYVALEPDYEPPATWDPDPRFDPDSPVPGYLPEDWFITPICNARWRPIPAISEFESLFRYKVSERAARLQEILFEDSRTFRLEAAFTGIVISALEQLGKPHPLEIIGDILDTAARAYYVTGVLSLNQKKIYNRTRAVQYFPELDPPIWPGHPAYPSGHSTQAHTAAYLLDAAMTLPGDPVRQQRLDLCAKALRIAQNREIAGVHFESDTMAGQDLARRCVDHLTGPSRFAEQFERIRGYFL